MARPFIAQTSPTTSANNACTVASAGTNFINNASGKCARMNAITMIHDSGRGFPVLAPAIGRKPGLGAMGPPIGPGPGFVAVVFIALRTPHKFDDGGTLFRTSP